jgi:hypothetical protein
MRASPRRFSTRKILGAILVVLLLGTGSFSAWAWQRATQSWGRFEARVEMMLGRMNARKNLRKSSEFAPLPGNAWEDYAAARRLLPLTWTGPDLGVLSSYEWRHPKADPKNVRMLVEEASVFLDRILQGTHRLDGTYPHVEHRRNQNQGDPYDLIASRARMIGMCRVRLLLEDRKIPEAVDLLLDLAVFGLDLLHRNIQIDVPGGLGCLSGVLKELRQILLAGELTPQELLRLDRRLEALDASWPDPRDAVEGDLLYLGLLLLEEDRRGKSLHEWGDRPRIRRTWSTFYSSRLRALQVYQKAEQYVGRALDAERLPVEEGNPLRTQLPLEMRNNPDPLFSLFYNIDRGVVFRRLQTRLRLARMVVHHLATGETLRLEDPLGGTLHLSLQENCLRAWRDPKESASAAEAAQGWLPSHRQVAGSSAARFSIFNPKYLSLSISE